MGKHQRPVIPDQILRIEVIDLPQSRDQDEGLYDVRWGHRPKDYENHDIITLKRYLDALFKNRRGKITQSSEDIIDRLQNFRIAYLNFATGEVTS